MTVNSVTVHSDRRVSCGPQDLQLADEKARASRMSSGTCSPRANAASTASNLLVLPHARVRGWRPPGGGVHLENRGELLPASEALSRSYVTDAHAVAYVATLRGRPWPWRLVSEAVGTPGLEIEMRWLLVDVDAPAHRSTPEWQAAMLPRVGGLRASPFVYFTRSGLRLVLRLAQPFPIRSREDEWRWRLVYRAWLDVLEREGVTGDRACSDWTRLQRMSRVWRDGELQEHPTIGDPESIGTVELPSVPDDDRSQSLLREHEPRERVGETGYDPGLLQRLLQSRGAIVGERTLHDGSMALVVRCPNARAHAPGHGESGDHALLFAGPLGRIHCQRSACAGIEGDRWLRLFTRAELAGAGVRIVRIADVLINVYDGERVRLCVVVEPADGGAPLHSRYVRISEGTRAFDALFAACDLETPDAGELQQIQIQVRGLRGCEISVEIDAAGRTRRILEVA